MPTSKKSASAAQQDDLRVLLRMLSSLALTDLPLSLDDLMLEAGATPEAAQRAIRALEAEQFVGLDADGCHYVVAPRFLQLAAAVRREVPQEREIRPLLRALAHASGETVTLNTYAPGANSSVCLMVEHSPAPLHYAVEVGEHKPLHAAASGKSILAFLPAEEIAAYVARTGLPPVTARTTTDAPRLMRELATIRRQGYAVTRGQRLVGAVAVSAPVLKAGQPLGSVVITIPEHRYVPANRVRLGKLVRATAAQIAPFLAGP